MLLNGIHVANVNVSKAILIRSKTFYFRRNIFLMKISSLSKLLLSSLFVVVIHFQTWSQCAECTPDTNCGGAANFPAVCPEQAADATAGEYYEQVLTFYIPNQVNDPGSGLQATIISVTITAVSGLPFGLTYTLNDADGVYLPSEGQNYGCATLCGTPLLPGTYSVQIAVSALVTAFGLQLTQNETFPTTITVLQGESSTGSFSFDQPAGCGSVEVNFDATIVAPAPAVTTYSWDFGNGQTSTQQNPSTIIYDTEGEYTASLTTTVSEYKLHSVSLQSVTLFGWMTDEDIIDQSPDPYFILYNSSGSAVYTSSAINNTSSNTWSGLNLSLDSPPYTIQFFDEDPVSADDNLGTADIIISAGSVGFNAGNGTTGSVTIGLDVTTQVMDETTIVVFPLPDADFTVNGNVLSCNDQDLFSYLWHRNGVMIPNATSSTYTMTEGGQYYCEVHNEFGCTSISTTYLYCPPVTINYDVSAMELEVANIYSSYQWSFNGLPIDGATTYFVLATESGNYAVQVTTNYGCTTTSQVYTLSVGVEELSRTTINLYPNPVEDFLVVQTDITHDSRPLRITDVSGKTVFEEQILSHSKFTHLDLSNLSAGVYMLQFGKSYARIVKR